MTRDAGAVPRARVRDPAILGWILVLVLGGVAGCSRRDAGKPKEGRGISHEAGIPILPRGKVVLAAAKGEKYLVEIHASVAPQQALQFYSHQLAKEQWEDYVAQQVEDNVWGLTARRGLFNLTGRIKKLPNGILSIAFERTIRKEVLGWRPPAPRDLPLLETSVVWEKRVFQPDGSRVEFRGKCGRATGKVLAELRSELSSAGWTVSPTRREDELPVTKGSRSASYVVEATRQGSAVRVTFPLEDYGADATSAQTPSPAVGNDADARVPDAAAAPAENLVPLPADLRLWASDKDVLGRQISDDIMAFTLYRSCPSGDALLKEVRSILEKRGYKLTQAAKGFDGSPIGGGATSSPSMTLFKGKKAVVVIVAQDAEQCSVQLTATSN